MQSNKGRKKAEHERENINAWRKREKIKSEQEWR